MEAAVPSTVAISVVATAISTERIAAVFIASFPASASYQTSENSNGN